MSKSIEMHWAETCLSFACALHDALGQKYDDKPYSWHIVDVYDRAKRHGLSAAQLAAAALHDVLEDCHMTSEQLHKAITAACAQSPIDDSWAYFSEEVMHLVQTLTGEPSEARYANWPSSLAVKICDRIGNLVETTDQLFLGDPSPRTLRIAQKYLLQHEEVFVSLIYPCPLHNIYRYYIETCQDLLRRHITQ